MTMTKPYIGGCACGAIRYETSSKPIVESHCQCRDCQNEAAPGMDPIWSSPGEPT